MQRFIRFSKWRWGNLHYNNYIHFVANRNPWLKQQHSPLDITPGIAIQLLRLRAFLICFLEVVFCMFLMIAHTQQFVMSVFILAPMIPTFAQTYIPPGLASNPSQQSCYINVRPSVCLSIHLLLSLAMVVANDFAIHVNFVVVVLDQIPLYKFDRNMDEIWKLEVFSLIQRDNDVEADFKTTLTWERTEGLFHVVVVVFLLLLYLSFQSSSSVVSVIAICSTLNSTKYDE